MTTLIHNQLNNVGATINTDTSRCRSCFERPGRIDMFNARIDKLLLWEIIKYCTNEQVSLDIQLPSKLCKSCFKKFHDTYFFIKEFRKTQEKFIKPLNILNDYDSKIDIDDDFNTFLNHSETKVIPNVDKTNIDDEISTFMNEFEVKRPVNAFKKKFKRITPIFKELCDILAENRKQLLRPDEKVIKQPKQNAGDDAIREIDANSKVNNEANDAVISEETLDKGENMDEILRRHIESHVTTEENGIPNCEFYNVSPNIPEKSLKKFLTDFILTDPRKEQNTQCFECLTIFSTGADLRRHSKATGHDIAPRYKCTLCGKLFKFRHTYRHHLKNHKTALEDSVCEICGACVRTTNLLRHMEKHGDGNACLECGKNFTQKAYLSMHMKKHHSTENPKKELCHICGVQRNNLSGLNQHMNKKHREATNWSHQCEICSLSFISKFSLNLHVQKMHTQNSVCKKISRRTKTNRTKRSVSDDGTHIEEEEETGAEKRKKEGKKIVQCSICLKQVTAATLYHHMRIHQGLKPYQCNVCLKTFRQCHHLKSHMNIHLDLKPYECKYCKKCFRHQTTLIIHTRSHTGETPYVCRVCNKGFAHSSSMKKHEEIHFKKGLYPKVF